MGIIKDKPGKTRAEPQMAQEAAAATQDGQTPIQRTRDAKGRFLRQEKGASVLPGRPFQARDKRASEAGRASGAARREKADLRRLCQVWMETEVGTGKDGKPITGGQMMVNVAVKEVARGNPRFWELLRDTAGFKPVDRVMVAEVDQGVIDEVEQLVQEMSES